MARRQSPPRHYAALLAARWRTWDVIGTRSLILPLPSGATHGRANFLRSSLKLTGLFTLKARGNLAAQPGCQQAVISAISVKVKILGPANDAGVTAISTTSAFAFAAFALRALGRCLSLSRPSAAALPLPLLLPSGLGDARRTACHCRADARGGCVRCSGA